MLHLASAIAYGTSGMPQIEWLDDDHIRASINGKAVELDDISKFVFDRIETVETILEKEILLGHKFDDFGYTSAKIVDVLQNTRIGYSFVDNGDNGFIKFKDKLMETLLLLITGVVWVSKKCPLRFNNRLIRVNERPPLLKPPLKQRFHRSHLSI